MAEPRKESPRATALLLNYGLAAAGASHEMLKEAFEELRAYIIELESRGGPGDEK